MSFDLNVLVCTEQFPTDAWQALLSEVGETTKRAPEDLPGNDRVIHEWVTRLDESSLFTTLYKLDRPSDFGSSEEYRWRIGVSANSGCSPLARWAQFNIPYLCFDSLEGAVAHDPQSGAVFDAPEVFWEFACQAIARWPGLPRELRRLGLMSDDGKLKTGRSK